MIRLTMSRGADIRARANCFVRLDCSDPQQGCIRALASDGGSIREHDPVEIALQDSGMGNF